MNLKGLATLVTRRGLPALGTALGGPLGGAVAAEIARRVGIPEADPEVLQQAIGDPETMARLRELDADLARERTEQLRIAAADTQQARETHKGHWMPSALSLCLVIMLIAAGYGLFTLEIPDANRDMANIAFGALLTAFGTATSYWLGSSRGSAERAKTIDQMVERQ